MYTSSASLHFAVGKIFKISCRMALGTVVREVPESRTPNAGVEAIVKVPEEVVIEIELSSTQNPVISFDSLGSGLTSSISMLPQNLDLSIPEKRILPVLAS